jgi:hypothetical protein
MQSTLVLPLTYLIVVLFQTGDFRVRYSPPTRDKCSLCRLPPPEATKAGEEPLPQLPLHAFRRTMVLTSSHPAIEIPGVDIWQFLFEREDREWPDNKSMYDLPTTPFFRWAEGFG